MLWGNTHRFYENICYCTLFQYSLYLQASSFSNFSEEIFLKYFQTGFLSKWYSKYFLLRVSPYNDKSEWNWNKTNDFLITLLIFNIIQKTFTECLLPWQDINTERLPPCTIMSGYFVVQISIVINLLLVDMTKTKREFRESPNGAL